MVKEMEADDPKRKSNSPVIDWVDARARDLGDASIWMKTIR